MTQQHGTPDAGRAAAPPLVVRNLGLRFGGIVALDDVSFAIPDNGICGLIGPNGAGKSSLFNCISRLYEPTSGEILWRGAPLSKLARHEVAHAGIGRTFQNLALFRSMSVLENIKVGAHCRSAAGFAAGLFKTRRVKAEEARVAEWADELTAFVGLQQHAHTRVDALPFGLQKRVELARALACRPSLLLLDEPAAGLNADELDALSGLVRASSRRYGMAVLLVEHHMGFLMKLSDHVVALDFGRKIAEGTPREVQANPAVIGAYLGAAPQ
jgi:branched-chain amino acid transport system ATP-binding protein